MPKRSGRRRIWMRRLLNAFCVRHSQSEERLVLKMEEQLRIELQELRLLYNRPPMPFDEWEEALWIGGLAVVAPKGASIPILDICVGFENYELRKSRFIYTSYSSTHWDRVINQYGFCKLACEQYPEEPVIDGLPASIWLECVEPTLSILKSLSILKHRKCNLTFKKKMAENFIDSGRSQHGDFIMGPFPLMALPRRGIFRMEIRLGLRAEAPNILQGSFHERPLSRNSSRRHRERILYRSLNNDDNVLLPVEPVEVSLSRSRSDADVVAVPDSLRAAVRDEIQLLANFNQNANGPHHVSIEGRLQELFPEIEELNLEEGPNENESDAELAEDDGRPETPLIPGLPANYQNPQDVQAIINEMLQRAAQRIGAHPLMNGDIPRNPDPDDSLSSLESDVTNDDDNVEGTVRSHQYREEENERDEQIDLAEVEAQSLKDDSDESYDEGELILSDSELEIEDSVCCDKPRYIWNEYQRVLEKNSHRAGPPESPRDLNGHIQDFFASKTGEWRNSVAGAKLLRLGAKDSYTRRYLMLAISTYIQQKNFGHGPIEFRPVKVVNKPSTPREFATTKTRPREVQRNGRFRECLTSVWENLRFRFRTLTRCVTGHVE